MIFTTMAFSPRWLLVLGLDVAFYGACRREDPGLDVSTTVPQVARAVAVTAVVGTLCILYALRA
jgi:hypothetical protein